jgi:hypothetical protein
MRIKFIYVLVSVLGIAQGISAQNSARYQALFLYNFTRYIQWPSISSSEFVIGVLGKTDVFSELKGVVGDKKVGSHAISVKQFSTPAEVGTCQILFVANDASGQVPQLVTSLQSKNTLIITERSGLSRKGAGICFAMEDGKQRFEISKTNIERTGLMINNQLVDMAIVKD